ncbi:hypothetical protein D3C80_1338260 [compost metagenome]
MAHRSRIEVLDQEDAGLLDFSNEGHFVTVLDGYRQGQYDFVEIAFQTFLLGVQVQGNTRLPLLTEDRRAFRRFERQVTHIDALQGKLRGVRFVACCCAVVLFVGHDRSFLLVGSSRNTGSSLEQFIQFAGALKGIQVVAATDMKRVDPDLRYRGTARLAGHLGADLWLAVDLDLFEGNTFAFEQALGADAVGAPIAGIYDDLGHFTSPAAGYRHASWTHRQTVWRRCNRP